MRFRIATLGITQLELAWGHREQICKAPYAHLMLLVSQNRSQGTYTILMRQRYYCSERQTIFSTDYVVFRESIA